MRTVAIQKEPPCRSQMFNNERNHPLCGWLTCCDNRDQWKIPQCSREKNTNVTPEPPKTHGKMEEHSPNVVRLVHTYRICLTRLLCPSDTQETNRPRSIFQRVVRCSPHAENSPLTKRHSYGHIQRFSSRNRDRALQKQTLIDLKLHTASPQPSSTILTAELQILIPT